MMSSALQRAENSSTAPVAGSADPGARVSVLFSEPKIPQPSSRYPYRARAVRVSVLFSEPKIPQPMSVTGNRTNPNTFQCSSASRKFLNGVRGASVYLGTAEFQCSSASRKFLNGRVPTRRLLPRSRFSALQRAENSSTASCTSAAGNAHRFQCSSASRKFLNLHQFTPFIYRLLFTFQCSSASRKFLNRGVGELMQYVVASFSALQRAENSSTKNVAQEHLASEYVVSVLFSEPKIPQPDTVSTA